MNFDIDVILYIVELFELKGLCYFEFFLLEVLADFPRVNTYYNSYVVIIIVRNFHYL